ncbi:MAG: hypothetical protein P8J87_01620 [Verrucomicrobiales bacterium]|nr:hypothetical protein [Verrucomicrobiales bacterium]
MGEDGWDLSWGQLVSGVIFLVGLLFGEVDIVDEILVRLVKKSNVRVGARYEIDRRFF